VEAAGRVSQRPPGESEQLPGTRPHGETSAELRARPAPARHGWRAEPAPGRQASGSGGCRAPRRRSRSMAIGVSEDARIRPDGERPPRSRRGGEETGLRRRAGELPARGGGLSTLGPRPGGPQTPRPHAAAVPGWQQIPLSSAGAGSGSLCPAAASALPAGSLPARSSPCAAPPPAATRKSKASIFKALRPGSHGARPSPAQPRSQHRPGAHKLLPRQPAPRSPRAGGEQPPLARRARPRQGFRDAAGARSSLGCGDIRCFRRAEERWEEEKDARERDTGEPCAGAQRGSPAEAGRRQERRLPLLLIAAAAASRIPAPAAGKGRADSRGLRGGRGAAQEGLPARGGDPAPVWSRIIKVTGGASGLGGKPRPFSLAGWRGPGSPALGTALPGIVRASNPGGGKELSPPFPLPWAEGGILGSPKPPDPPWAGAFPGTRRSAKPGAEAKRGPGEGLSLPGPAARHCSAPAAARPASQTPARCHGDGEMEARTELEATPGARGCGSRRRVRHPSPPGAGASPRPPAPVPHLSCRRWSRGAASREAPVPTVGPRPLGAVTFPWPATPLL